MNYYKKKKENEFNTNKDYSATASCTENCKADLDFSYYSKLLKRDFDSLKELRAAEAKYNEEKVKKEAAAAERKADANKVDAAFKALYAAIKTYKQDRAEVTKLYKEALKGVQLEYEQRLAAINETLSEAETAYKTALKEFTDKNQNGYHLTLRDGDGYEAVFKSTDSTGHFDFSSLFDLLFKF